jgi:hypothetical protein
LPDYIKTTDVIAVTWKDVHVVLTNYSSKVVKRIGKGLIVHYEDISNLQLKFNKMQEGANRILVTSQAVPNWKS